MTDATRRAKEVEQQITQRFIAALRLWNEQRETNRLGDLGTLKVDCADLIAAALQQVERDTYTRAAALVGHQVTGPGPLRQHLVALLRHHATEGSR